MTIEVLDPTHEGDSREFKIATGLKELKEAKDKDCEPFIKLDTIFILCCMDCDESSVRRVIAAQKTICTRLFKN